MKLIVSDNSKYNEQIERFNKCITLLQKIFTRDFSKKFTDELDAKIDTITVYTDRALIGGGYYGDTNVENGKFNIRYGTSKVENENLFIALHELSHVIITPINKNMIYNENNIVSSQGITKLDKNKDEFYGMAFTESFCNIISKIAILKNNKENVNNYMINGLNDYVFNYYEPFEDITRLLIIASKNDYLIEYNFDEAINFGGIDIIIGEPINKPYSIFINSAINCDFTMENEFDRYTNKNEFRNMCRELDEEMLKIKINDNNDLPNYDISVFEKQLVRIENYYFNKLEYLYRNSEINSLTKEKMLNKFENIVNSIKTKLQNMQ